MACWEDEMFKNPAAPEEFACPICYGVLKDSVRDPHDHVFGETCILNSFKNNGNCPLTRTSIRGQLAPAADIRERMALEEVYCCTKRDGCKWEGKLADIDAHLKHQCEFFPLPCRFLPCPEFLVRSEVLGHEEKCLHRPVPCSYCGKDFHAKSLEAHINNDCPEFLVLCPDHCQQMFSRKLKEFHKKYTCNLRQKHCRFAHLGCQFRGLPDEISSHMQLAAFLHLSLAETRVAQAQALTAELNRYVVRMENLANTLGEGEAAPIKKELLETIGLIKAFPSRKFETSLVSFYVPRKNPTEAITYGPSQARAVNSHGDVVLLEQEFNANSQLVFSVLKDPQEVDQGLTIVGFTQKMEVAIRPDQRLVDPNDKRFLSVVVGKDPVEGIPFLRAEAGEPIMLDYVEEERKVIVTNLNSNEEVEVPAEIEMTSWQPFMALWGNQTIRLESLAEKSEYLP